MGWWYGARWLLADAAKVRARTHGTAEGATNILRAGYSEAPGPAREIVRAATLAFRARHPEVHLVVDGTPEVRRLEEVRAGRLDVGFTLAIVDVPALSSETLAEYTHDGGLVCATHAAADAGAVSLHDLRELPVLTFPHAVERSQWSAIVPAFQALGCASEVRAEVENPSAGFALVAAGAAWTFAPESARGWPPSGVAYCRVPGLSLAYRERMIWRHADAPPALLAFGSAVRCERDRATSRAPLSEPSVAARHVSGGGSLVARGGD